MKPLRQVSLQVSDLLLDLKAKCAEAVGQEAAQIWHESISGVCVDEKTQLAVCVEIDGEQHTEHWLLGWLNQRLEPGPVMRRHAPKTKLPQGDDYSWPLSYRHDAPPIAEVGALNLTLNLIQATVDILKKMDGHPMSTYDLLDVLDRSATGIPSHSTCHFLLRLFAEINPRPFLSHGEKDVVTTMQGKHRLWLYQPAPDPATLPYWAK